ncbi:hypothetical protein [Streptomyces flavotricini]|uniref:hypothetical protein n=1 Tax=Streptomyces flavotricini TaxID=66888 RepID=UPI001E366927|nr:hypothetical protein [Streptomyces flavotricini]
MTLLIRRNRSTGELAYCRCYSPAAVPLTTLVRVAGSRWRVEESPDELIPLTCDEIQRLFMTLVIQRVFDPVHRLGWSLWRRRRQARSQTSRYRRQAAQA